MRTRGYGLRPCLDRLDDRCLLSTLTPQLLTRAYGLDAITLTSPSGAIVKGDGTGTTIALIEAYHTPSLAADLHTFDRAFGLPDPKLTVVNQAGTRTNPAWAAEASLDLEWAHAIAPGAELLVVEARSQAISDLLAAVDVARSTPGVVAISMSWGFAETGGEVAFDSHFTTPPGHAGITFVAASGDSGSWSGAEYPAVSPRVLAVGGTTLSLDPAGNYLSEDPWSSSGGGYSRYESRPRYQRAVQATAWRSSPDVAFVGDPDTGVAVYQTPLDGSRGTWQTIGGTSLGAPAWAAIIAIADQGRALWGKASLDGPTQTLPTLYDLGAADFHTIRLPPPASPWGGGVNPTGFFPFGAGSFSHGRGPAGSGPHKTKARAANTVTGLGSPNAPPLIADLVASTTTAGLPTARSPALSRPTTSLGHRGNSPHRHAEHPGQTKRPDLSTRYASMVPGCRRVRQVVPTRRMPTSRHDRP